MIAYKLTPMFGTQTPSLGLAKNDTTIIPTYKVVNMSDETPHHSGVVFSHEQLILLIENGYAMWTDEYYEANFKPQTHDNAAAATTSATGAGLEAGTLEVDL